MFCTTKLSATWAACGCRLWVRYVRLQVDLPENVGTTHQIHWEIIILPAKCGLNCVFFWVIPHHSIDFRCWLFISSLQPSGHSFAGFWLTWNYQELQVAIRFFAGHWGSFCTNLSIVWSYIEIDQHIEQIIVQMLQCLDIVHILMRLWWYKGFCRSHIFLEIFRHPRHRSQAFRRFKCIRFW